MSEIKVGEYVRIKNGPIRKIITINEGKEKTIFGKYRLDKDYNNCRSVAENKIIKHSPNIIDLIEEGDYVNGSRVIDASDFNKGCMREVYCEDDEEFGIWNENINSVVTKEQFSQMEYKVKE